MRYYNEDKDLKLYAVAGTQTVLLSFDIDKTKLGNQFLGFSVERIDNKKTGISVQVTYLNGTKYFESLENNPDPIIKKRSLVQSFYWQDYIVDPAKTYTYTIKAMIGPAINPSVAFESDIVVTTEKLHDGKHSIFFNYGVTGSQSYARNFNNKPLSEMTPSEYKRALDILGRDLWSEGLLKFIRQATDSTYTIYGAFYEFQLPEFLAEIKAAKDRGVKIELIVSGKEDQYEDKTYKNGTIRLNNKSMMTNSGIDDCIKTLRTKPSQPHNKFMVLLKDNIAKQVWFGSTNITLAGIFGQCNTGHWVVDNTIAKQYEKYWLSLLGDPTMGTVAKTSMEIQKSIDLTNLENGEYVFFSPRDLPKISGAKPVQLQHYADLIDSAKEMVCMVFPFNMDDVFNTVYNHDKDYLRLLLFESASDAQKVTSNDIDLKVSAGAIYQGTEKNWAKEVTTKATTGAGILYVHNKFFLIDPLSEDPIVVTGSANFSSNSILNNDENTMLIKGDKRTADIYLTEFDRLFVHFWPRYLTKINPANSTFSKPLDESYSWYQVYFDDNRFQTKRKKIFQNMKGAVKG
ncbi:phosphatidylserine/phosphatidylglycerophosphate/cardiolipin synthase-like enzyme [Flavobacterium sp. 270]|uniref:phospholipase D-like domain-containing protein n=1 Tax=Flavobacterium sp. 270 TaxID=2512114 RepID=UPI001066ED66|nr:phospholipase D-like domain-containing protein [Flavobacterium sp. 270]TDW51670.1 phosphatidylserine/phosphatidylglycerophosphate/cardiolipin synthase-like enzyme [Flavobacterium sp. 270]